LTDYARLDTVLARQYHMISGHRSVIAAVIAASLS